MTDEQQATVTAETAVVDAGHSGQRVDNFLIGRLKGVPRSRIYRALRNGEVRINGARCKPARQLQCGDRVRIPPIRRSSRDAAVIPETMRARIPVLFEDDHLLIVDKPPGLAVHGGSGMDFGLIEAMRQFRTDLPFLELAHRLDRDTSGCLVLAKTRTSLLAVQEQLQGEMKKYYLALVAGKWEGGPVNVPLLRQQQTGARKVIVDPGGQPARTVFSPRCTFKEATLMSVRLYSGRMHQVRVHAASREHPVAADDRYGDRAFNRKLKRAGLHRLFLHAERLRFRHPVQQLQVEAYSPLPPDLQGVLDHMEQGNA